MTKNILRSFVRLNTNFKIIFIPNTFHNPFIACFFIEKFPVTIHTPDEIKNSTFLNENPVLFGDKDYWCTKSVNYQFWYSSSVTKYQSLGILPPPPTT